MWFLLYREVNGDEKREFKEIRKVSKVCPLKISHSASSLILKLDIQLQRLSGCRPPKFFPFFVSSSPTRSCNNDGRHLRDFVQLGGLGVGDWEAVWWCGGGLELEVGGTPPNPGHATKRLPRCPKAHQQIHHLIRQFVTNSRVAFDALKASGCLRCRQF